MTMAVYPRVFVLGSSVSRDAFESLPGRFDLSCYIARTSFASIGLPHVADRDVREKVAALASPFQRRMATNDLDKTTLATIRALDHDILLIDLIDERFKLALTGNTLFSISGELENAGFELGDRAIMHPGSATYMNLWAAGFERFISSVDPKKVVLNRAYWAERFPDGAEASSLNWIRNSNLLLQRLYEVIDRHWALRSIDYPPDLVRADRDHRWGVAPYHYAKPFYEHTINELERLLQERARPLLRTGTDS